MRVPFLTGSYAQAEQDGVCRIELDTAQGTLTKTHGWSGFVNPSYVIHDQSGMKVFIVEELTPEGRVVSALLSGRQLSVRSRLPSFGADPCHLCLWPDQRTLIVCNYTDGSFSAYRVHDDGSLTNTQAEKLSGGSVDPRRQECAHMHFSTWRDGSVYLVDLGTDRVCVRPANETAGVIESSDTCIRFSPGCGPRHLVFGEKGFLYVVSELQNQVCVFRPVETGYQLVQTVDTVESGRGGLAAAIRRRGRRLFVSNRGEDDIVMYLIDDNGLLTLLDRCPTGGKVPRDFELAGDHIIVANQDSSLLTVLRLNDDQTRIMPSDLRLGLTKPTCICLL